MFNILPNENALQQTREAVAEGAGVVIYWLTGKLKQDAETARRLCPRSLRPC
jgi:hypothetical protein